VRCPIEAFDSVALGWDTARMEYAHGVVSNAELAETLFQLAESHPPGDLRLALLRAAYAVFDHPRELDGTRRMPGTIPLEVLPTVTMLRGCRGADALAAAAQRLCGPQRVRGNPAREGFLTAAEACRVVAAAPGLDPRQLRGAVHWHTRASDGAVSMEAMSRACMRRGASWAVVTDHTRGLACVNGLDDEGIELQRRAVASWNRRRGDELWMVQGLEVEILEDGRLDVPRAARSGLLLVAAVHTGLAERRDQTGRLVRAIEEPGVWALAHPRGRLFARRAGIRANWEVVFTAAAEFGVLLEINGFPRRQDLDPALLALAREAGCRFLLASDAHHPRHLAFEATAVALASRAGVPRGAIVNFEPLDHLAAQRPDLATP
jgi:histidinol phosphatase-like PHP family hydrolase